MSEATAVLRAWGVPRTLLLAVLLAVAVQVVAASYVGLPSFAALVPALDLAPPAAALLLTAPLVDQTPDLTLRAARPVWLVLLLRYAAAQGAGVIVVVSLTLSAWTLERSLVVVTFLAGGALAVGLVGGWYWVPLLGGSYAWLWHVQHLADPGGTGVGVAGALVTLVLAGVGYVLAGTYRIHRVRCPRR